MTCASERTGNGQTCAYFCSCGDCPTVPPPQAREGGWYAETLVGRSQSLMEYMASITEDGAVWAPESAPKFDPPMAPKIQPADDGSMAFEDRAMGFKVPEESGVVYQCWDCGTSLVPGSNAVVRKFGVQPEPERYDPWDDMVARVFRPSSGRTSVERSINWWRLATLVSAIVTLALAVTAFGHMGISDPLGINSDGQAPWPVVSCAYVAMVALVAFAGYLIGRGLVNLTAWLWSS